PSLFQSLPHSWGKKRGWTFLLSSAALLDALMQPTQILTRPALHTDHQKLRHLIAVLPRHLFLQLGKPPRRRLHDQQKLLRLFHRYTDSPSADTIFTHAANLFPTTACAIFRASARLPHVTSTILAFSFFMVFRSNSPFHCGNSSSFRSFGFHENGDTFTKHEF